MSARTYELAVQEAHGDWTLLGDYPSEDAAIEAARTWAADHGADIHRDDFGTAAFGISNDPASGHYETLVEIYSDGSHMVY